MKEFTSVRFVLNRRAKVRYEKLEGVEHTVVPTTMMVEGVHRGSKGDLYYSANQLAKNPSAWDHKPAVVYHPKSSSGQYISACTPEVLNTSKAGILLNTRYKGKQQTDVYLNPKRADEIDPRIMESIRNENPINVSTGMYYDVIGPGGVWNGEEYLAEVGDFTPDHLAILPDQDGACSIADGAGMLVNEDLPKIMLAKGNKDIKDHLAAIQRIVLNEMSADQVFSALMRAARSSIERFGQSWDGWIQDVYPKYFIYTANGVYYKQNYKALQNAVELAGDPVVVVRTYSYETAEGFAINTNPTPDPILKEEKEMAFDPKTAVDGLIANGGWKEGNRTFLLSLKPDELEQIVANNKAVTIPQNQPTAPATQMLLPTPTAPVAPVVNQQPGSIESRLGTIQDPEIRALLANMLQEREQKKLMLVNHITSTPGNRFNPEWLKTRPVEELEGMVSLAQGVRTTNYVGNQFGGSIQDQLSPMFIPNNGQIVANQGAGEQPILPLP